jgi:hypothetical protein
MAVTRRRYCGSGSAGRSRRARHVERDLLLPLRAMGLVITFAARPAVAAAAFAFHKRQAGHARRYEPRPAHPDDRGATAR